MGRELGARRPHRAALCLVLIALAFVTGCSVPVATALDDADSNRVMVALEKSGVAAQKEQDPGSEGHWRVTVARDDAPAAVAVLTQEGLPPPSTPGVLDALGKGSIVPSRTAEHAKLIVGTAGDLEHSLLAVDGVLSARVHLAVPEKTAFFDEGKEPAPTASVLIRHSGATPPIAVQQVQRLVAGAVPGLEPDHVSVVETPSATPSRPPERELSRFGPITVTRSSMLPLRLMVGGAVLLNVLLLGLLVFVWGRARRTSLALTEAQTEGSRRDAT
jgi:type III secretion protein J